MGYAGLDASEDFFMDEGKMSMPPGEKVVERNMKAIKGFLSSNRTDFISYKKSIGMRQEPMA